MTDAKTQEPIDGDAFAELRQLAQLRGEGPIVSPNPLSPPAAGRGEPIGTVEAVNGEVISSGVDQTNSVLKPGDPIYEGDIVATRGGAGVQIDFADGTVGHLGPEARMLVQDVGTGAGSTAPVVFVINGPFSFASPPGGSAGANALTVRTPVASVRLEGGRLIGKAAPEAVENKFTLMRNFDGTLGRAVVATASASFVLDGELASAQVVSLFRAPSELPTPTLAQAQEEVGGSVFDWLGAPEAGGEGTGGAEDAIETIGPISVLLPGSPQISFPEPHVGGLNRLSNSGPARPAAQESSTTPPVSGGNTEVLPSTPDAPINITVQSSFGGIQTFNGTAGFDTFVANGDPTTANAITIEQELDGFGVETGRFFLRSGTDRIFLDGFEELDINLGTADDTITIQDLSDTDIADSTVRIDLGAGNDTADATNANRRHVIDGGDGNDTITGSSRGDDLNGDAGADTIKGLAGKDKINGGVGNDTIDGGAGDDTITGGADNDTIDGGTGADAMDGGAGDDTFTVDNVNDTVTDTGGGTDLVNSSVTFTLNTGLENLTLTGTANIDGTGNEGANTLTGNSGNNRLDGHGGADAMTGNAGNDTYVVDNTGDTVTEGAGAGTDTVESSVTFTLAANVENLALTGTHNIDGTGNSAANTLTGNDGNNRLDGAGGADSMSGGAGDDIYVVDNAGDTVSETTSGGTDAGGTDTVESSVAFTLGAGFENLELTGSGNINGTGNSLDNTVKGNAGNNTLDGGTGGDTMDGGAGDDTYVVDNTGDTVTDTAGGTDTVQSSVAFTLASGVENLELTGSAAIAGTGNAGANTITGNSANNTLTGNAGNDIINGGAGVDTISGGADNDTIDGGTGADVMDGGAGDDTFTVDNVGDTVTDTGGGTDQVNASATFTLTTGVENLTLTGNSAIDGTGNAGANTITGNSGINTLTGGDGDDTYFVQNTGDTVVENSSEGTDTVSSSVSFTITDEDVEHLTLTGSSGNSATGNASANTLTGNTGNNTLTGLGGGDALVGGAGTDTASYAGSAAVNVNLSTGVVSGGDAVGDSFSSIENLTGSSNDDTLTGDANANRIDGGAGEDTMTGLGGNDVYVVDNVNDSVVEAGGGGTDTVESSVTIAALFAEVENLTLTGSSAIDGTGNGLANTITGNSGNNALAGGAGDDIYVVQNAGDTVVENAAEGTDRINTSVSFTLSANVENMVLTGAGITGTGNALDNTFFVDDTGDQVVEAASGGVDTVSSSVSYTITDEDVEHLTLTGSASNSATGNASANTLTGNTGDNVLIGLGGGDALVGGDGSDTASYAGSTAVSVNLSSGAVAGGDAVGDTFSSIENLIGSSNVDALTGDANANRIDGGAGADNMAGLGGDDTYVVDNVSDVVTEAGGSGEDTVESSVTFTLVADIEHLTLTGASSVNGTGNTLDNTITGNSAANSLIGLGGVDTLTGGGGNDILFGGAGADILNADSGADDLYFNATGEGGDTVNNFTTGTDDFVFLQSAFGGGSLATGTLDATNFSVITEAYDGTNGTSSAATGNTAGFIYDSTNGVLSYDSNGNTAGGGFTIATLSSGSVAASDVEITAASPV